MIEIVDKDAKTVARYTYDAWGVCTITQDSSECNIASINPYRYRGYYYDPEIGLYYLQSRYYDPGICRFLNADDTDIVRYHQGRTALNLCAYANNSPIMLVDETGYSPTLVLVGGITVSLGLALTYISVALTAVGILAVLLNRTLRRKLTTALTNVWNSSIDTAGYLKNAIIEVVKKARCSRWYFGKDVHHIVARTDPRASQSRELLQAHQLSPYEAYNLVVISRTLHKHLHTSAYHYAVYLFLVNCSIKAKNASDRKYSILAGLVIISAILSAASRLV